VITLGVDIGTTRIKVLALDVDTAQTLALASGPTPVHPDGMGEVHHPAEVLRVAIALMAEAVSRLKEPARVAAISVASVGEEVVLFDDRGAPLDETIVWYDPRGVEEAAAFVTGPGRDLPLTARFAPDATFSLFKLLWHRDHQADRLVTARTWTDLGDAILHGLGAALTMDLTHASRAGAFDLVSRTWDDQTIAAAGLDLDFPRLVSSATSIGRLSAPIAERTGLRPGVELISGGHDHLCAAYGAGLRGAAELFISAGTSEAHLALLDAPLERASTSRVDQGCYVDGHSWYAHVNVHAGHFFRQWRELLFADASDDELFAEAARGTTHGVAFSPSHDQRHANLTAVPYDADRAAVMRAVLEGLARHSAHIIEQLERAAGHPFGLVVAAGTPTRQPLWRALRLAAYGRPVAGVDEPEITAWGAASVAARALIGAAADELVARRTTWTGSGR
jgi:sugar (pentulose or hexulose) kinase